MQKLLSRNLFTGLQNPLQKQLLSVQAAKRSFGNMMSGDISGAVSAPGADALELWKTNNRSGILMTIDNDTGSLVQCLDIIAKNGISLT